jgi:hypothetical protein
VKQPKVGCIMPTMASRDQIRPLAIACYKAQTWENRCLYIVSDRGPNIASQLPKADNIKYCHLGDDKKYTNGVKWNTLTEWAIDDGCDWIAIWPDDDWQAPWFVERRMKKAIETGANRVSVRSMIFWMMRTRDLWLYTCAPDKKKHWSCHGSMILSKDLWRQTNGYPDMQPGADSLFQDQEVFFRSHPGIVGDWTGYIALQHGANTYVMPNEPISETWRNITQEGWTLERIMGEKDAAKWQHVLACHLGDNETCSACI